GDDEVDVGRTVVGVVALVQWGKTLRDEIDVAVEDVRGRDTVDPHARGRAVRARSGPDREVVVLPVVAESLAERRGAVLRLGPGGLDELDVAGRADVRDHRGWPDDEGLLGDSRGDRDPDVADDQDLDELAREPQSDGLS